MRKEFVFCELGGMTRPLLRTNWAANLNTSDQVKILHIILRLPLEKLAEDLV